MSKFLKKMFVTPRNSHSNISLYTTKINQGLKNFILMVQKKLIGTISPIDRMRARAEKAESLLKSSDLNIKKLQYLQDTSLDIIDKKNASISILQKKINENYVTSEIKRVSLKKLNKVFKKNKLTMKESATQLNEVNDLAFHDVLTGLPNRRLMNDRLKQMILSNKRSGNYSAAIFLDIDKFKVLNDTYGHKAGDDLLVSVANRLKLLVRESDTLARYGGDEFIILLSNLNSNKDDARAEADKISHKILASLNQPFAIISLNAQGNKKQLDYMCFASLGVEIFDGNMVEKKNILARADEAMYLAKKAGGNAIRSSMLKTPS